MPNQEIILDPTKLTSSDLSQGFDITWPISREEYTKVTNTMYRGLMSLSGATEYELEDRELLHVVGFHFMLDVLKVFQAAALVRRFKGNQLIAPSSYIYLNSIISGADLPQSPTIKEFYRAWPKRPQWKLPLRLLRSAVVRDGFSRIPPLQKKPNRLAVVTGSLISAHAKCLGNVPIVQFDEWFSPLGHDVALPTVDPGLINAVTQLVEASYREGGETLPDWVVTHVSSWLKRAMGLAKVHLQNIKSNNCYEPKELWVGSGAMLWSRLLGCHVQRSGGSVVGHDHGTGGGHRVHPYIELIEYRFLDRFITFTPRHAELLKACHPKGTSFEALPSGAHLKFPISKVEGQEAREPLTVMYMPSLPHGENVALQWYIPEVVVLDWEARMISKLRQLGFKVIVKPHPSRKGVLPPVDATDEGVTWEFGLFEKVMGRADVVLFENNLSTAFTTAVVNGKPIVFIDFGMDKLTDHGRSMLEQRCAIVDGYFDEKNRAQADWSKLGAGIRGSLDLKSPQFADELYLKQ